MRINAKNYQNVWHKVVIKSCFLSLWFPLRVFSVEITGAVTHILFVVSGSQIQPLQIPSLWSKLLGSSRGGLRDLRWYRVYLWTTHLKHFHFSSSFPPPPLFLLLLLLLFLLLLHLLHLLVPYLLSYALSSWNTKLPFRDLWCCFLGTVLKKCSLAQPWFW